MNLSSRLLIVKTATDTCTCIRAFKIFLVTFCLHLHTHYKLECCFVSELVNIVYQQKASSPVNVSTQLYV